ncbi:hypothetical protein PQX77_013777 [Marasmius sp. AFHP31]|nr:hypothetical protein PQX77_013777 [Marasmius sp. AFHP31]
MKPLPGTSSTSKGSRIRVRSLYIGSSEDATLEWLYEVGFGYLARRLRWGGDERYRVIDVEADYEQDRVVDAKADVEEPNRPQNIPFPSPAHPEMQTSASFSMFDQHNQE